MAKHFSEFDEFEVQQELRPIGAWGFFGLSVLFSIPVIGLICLIVFSFSDGNINRRNYARSYFIGLCFFIGIIALLYLTGVVADTLTIIRAGQYPEYLRWLPWAY